MEANEIKQKLHEFIDKIDSTKAAAIYTLFEDQIEQYSIPYSEQFKAELDRRLSAYYNEGKTVSGEEMRERLSAAKSKRA